MKMMTLVAAACIAAPLSAQQSANMVPVEPVPQITIGSNGQVKISPDRATIQISVQTKATTAAAAASENASKQAAVIAAIRALGLNADQISTAGYTVYPEQRYEPNREPVITGYNVTNSLSIEVRKLDQVGPVIDAALSKGANMVTSLQFFASNTEEARRRAIALAVQKARLDAEAAAQAGGGSLGSLLEVSIGAYVPPQPRPMVMMRTAAATMDSSQTPINPGEETVTVEVTTRWRFIGR
jgi:uncharacterized protein YggE